MLVIEKLREDGKLLPKELIGEVDSRVDDSGPVGADSNFILHFEETNEHRHTIDKESKDSDHSKE